MKNINFLLLCITLLSANFTVKAEDSEIQDRSAIGHVSNVLNHIENVFGTVQNADNSINTILPTDSTATGTGQQTEDILSASEIEKWQYINDYFTTVINDLNLFEKIGSFIKEYANFLAMPTSYFS